MSDETYKKIFSSNLQKYMDLTGKNQINLINDLGFNKSAVSTWCNGTRLPRMDKIDALARYFGIRRSDLIEEKSDSPLDSHYYLDEDAREAAEFLHKNPDYKILFNAARKIKKEDIYLIKQIMDRFSN